MKLKLLYLLFVSVFIRQTLLAAPVITAINPSSGPVGTVVTVFGAGLNSPTAFTIGGKPVIIISNTGTQLVAMVVPGISTGLVSVTTASGTAVSASVFTITEPRPAYTQQGAPVKGSGGIGTDPKQGYAVDLSADGNTAVVGAPFDNASAGAVYVFTRSGSLWTQQGNKLVGTGSTKGQLGAAVAISADGNTLAVGGKGYEGDGGIWVFVRSGNSWVQQGAKLTALGWPFGSAVAISADGNTIAAGGLTLGAWVFTRTGGNWIQQGGKLEGSGGSPFEFQGYSVALSADGNTLLSGATGVSINSGASWVFTRTGNVWTQQGQKLLGTGGIGLGGRANSVDLSADGNVAVVGSPGDNGNAGAFWIFARDNNGVWSQQGPKMVGSGGSPYAGQGHSVSISADGNTIVEGGDKNHGRIGATWVFKRNGGVWAQVGKKLVGTEGYGIAYQGSGVSISSDGTTILTGGVGLNSSWFFTSPLPGRDITFAQPAPLRYGMADTALAVTSTNTAYPVIFSSDNPDVVSIVANKIHIKAVGTANITASQAGDIISPVTRTLVITKAQLTVKADDKTKTEGTENPPFTATYTGFKNGDDTSAITVKPVFFTFATSGSPAANYAVTASGAGSSNYEFLYLPGTLTIVVQQHPGQPKITSFSPQAGPVGTLVTITGSNLNFQSGVTIGGKPAVVVSNGASKLVAMVMPGAANGPISISADSGSVTTSNNFSIKPTLYPILPQGGKITGSGNSTISGLGLGTAIALSADGNTAIVSAPAYDNQHGVAYIYIRTGNTWQQQGGKLAGTGSAAYSDQGLAVAISADGNTAVVGGAIDFKTGGAWVFIRRGDTWQQQGDKLGSADEQLGNRNSIAISANGNRIIIAAKIPDKEGGVLVFDRVGETWQQKAIIPGIASLSGSGLALSADGNTIAAAVAPYGSSSGTTWIFAFKGNSWVRQAKLTTDFITYFDMPVLLAADGNDVFIGCEGYLNDATLGDVSKPKFLIKHFKRTGESWAPQTEDYQKNYFTDLLTFNTRLVAIAGSADARTLLMAGPRSNSSYPQGVFVVSGINKFDLVKDANAVPQSLALSADGTTAMLGFPVEDKAGAIRVFVADQNHPERIIFEQPAPRYYGSADSVLAAVSTNPALPIIFTCSDTTIASVTGNKLHIKAAGTVSITASQADTLAAPVTRLMTISKAFITVKADNKTKTLGAENPAFTASYSGFKNGEDTTAIAEKPALTTIATQSSRIGTYPITVSGGSAANYQFKYVEGTLKIDPEQYLERMTLNPAAVIALTSKTAGGFNYEASVSPGTESVTLTPFTANADVQVTINGEPATGNVPFGPIALSVSDVTTVYVVATTKLGSTRRYVVNIVKGGSSDVSLKILALSDPAAALITPATSGVASVSASATAVRVYAVPNEPTTTVKVNSVLLTGPKSNPIAINPGNVPTTINVVITSQNGTVRTFPIQVNKTGSSDVSMKTLALTDPSAPLETLPSDGTIYNRKASVSFSAGSVRVYAVPNDSTTTVKVNGVLLTGPQSAPVALNAGNTPTDINVIVTSQNGTIGTYVIHINKTGSSDVSMKILGLINPSAILVNGPLNGTTYNKTASVSVSATAVAVRAVPNDPNTTVKVNGALLTGSTSSPVTLNAGNEPTDIYVLVTAETGVTRTYVIHINKTGSSDVTLKTLKLTNPTASVVSVSSGRLAYNKTATVPALTSSVKVYAVANDAASTIKVNGVLLTGTETAPINLNTDTAATIITVLVTADNGSARTYLIGVCKAPAVESMRSFAVAITPEIVVHQGLSPNGDGQNDVLAIDGLESFKDNHISIIDINGTLVYETKAYGANGNVFDGRSGKTGTLQKPGTYYYVLDYNDGTAARRKTGYIILKY